jgi:hypothetical protein
MSVTTSSISLSDAELGGILKRVVWDYDLSEEQLVPIFKGLQQAGGLNQATLFARLLNGYSWYQLIQWFGFETTQTFLNDDAIAKVFPPSYRRKLIYAQQVLRA